MDWFRFDMQQALPTEIRKGLKALSACIVSGDGRRVFAGINAAWLVSNALNFYGFSFSVGQMPSWLHRAADGVPDIPEMKRQVSGFAEQWPHYLLPWQLNLLREHGHRPGVHLWWAPGAGKTLGALTWGLLTPGRILFVTRSGARRTIARDAKRFTDATHYILEGEKATAIPDTRIVITGWDTLAAHVDRIIEWQPTTLIFDELHRAKNFRRRVAVPRRDENGNNVFDDAGGIKMDFVYRQNMTSAAKRIAEALSVKRRLGATASPIKDRLRDLWAQLDLVEPQQWGFFYDYARRYCAAREGEFGGIDTTGRSSRDFVEELTKRLAFCVNQVPYAVTHANLPAKRRQVTYLPKEQLLLDIGAEARKAMRESDREGVAKWMQAHARLAAAAERKRPALVEMIADNIGEKTKIVVLTGLRSATEKLHAAVAKKLPEITTWWGHGDTPQKQRDAIQDAYMEHPGPCILVGSYQTWGESLNLQDTDIAYIAMLPPTPGDVEQIEGRFARQGQRRPVTIHYVVAEGTYDEHVAQILIDKLPSVEKVVGDGSALDGFRKAIGGVENEAALIENVFAKIIAGTYEIDEDSR